MKNSTELKEQCGLLDDEFKALAALGDKATAENLTRMDAIIAETRALTDEVKKLETREAHEREVEARSKPNGVNILKPEWVGDAEEKVKRNFRYTELLSEAASGRGITDGFYKEIITEGRKSILDATGRNLLEGEIAIPSFITGGGKQTQRDIDEINWNKRALTTSTGDTPKAGYTIQTDVLAQDLIDVLRNRLVFTSMGSWFLTGLQGPTNIPKKTSDSGASWTAEGSAVSAADPGFGQLALTAKKLSNATVFSRELLGQSSLDIERLVRNDLVISQVLAVESAAVNGTGSSNQPTGILATSGIGSVAIGTNGGAPTLASIISLETEVAQDNADMGALWYLTNAKVRGKMKNVVKDAGSGIYLWDDRNGATPINGYGAKVTNMVPSTLTKGSSSGVCSANIFGNFSDLVIAQWGGLVLTVNPYSLDVNAQIRVVAHGFYDIGVRHAESFAACVDYTTT